MMENFENQEKTERQLDNLINLTENHTRTKRHLEQYSHIGDEDNKENARKIQQVREEQMQDLKDKIMGKDENNSPYQQLENVKEKYYNTQNYIENNKGSIDEEMMRNLQEKQQHREEQINFLEDEK